MLLEAKDLIVFNLTVGELTLKTGMSGRKTSFDAYGGSQGGCSL